MEENQIEISWIIATRNRKDRLQWNIEKLLDTIKKNEEIIVIDGNSTDGTEEYLDQLYKSGKINKYIRGKDRNQAHAWNKGLLAAKGKYIKKIIDDDVFDIETIRKCANKMNELPESDICISEDLSMEIFHSETVYRHSRYKEFLKWKNQEVPSFTFGDVHLIIRRSSLPLLGLYDISFTMMDYEYSLRVSYCGAGILFYTGCNALTMNSRETITANVSRKQLMKEGVRANAMYEYAGDQSSISHWSKIKIFIGKKRDILLKQYRIKNQEIENSENIESILKSYDYALNRLIQENIQHPGNFDFYKPEYK
jgi:glycosyltransferase involved in cell wall biosynthesis